MRVLAVPSIPARRSRLLAWLLLGLSLLGWAVPAYADSQGALREIFGTFEEISRQLTTAVGNALGTQQIETVVNVLFTSLSLGLFVWKFAGMAMRGFDLLELLTLMLTIFFVYIILSSYKVIFPPMFDAGRYVADLLGKGISGEDGASMAEAIFRMLVDMDFTPDCDFIECVSSKVLSIPAAVAAYVLTLVLGIVATLVELWTLWGFQIAFAVGWITVPFLMFERLSFLFDGWLKFFFGMIVYVVVAKINLALVLLGMKLMLGTEGGTSVAVGGFFDIIGMVVFMVVGIATLYCTGKFASSIVANAGGGGVGEAVQKVATTAATVAGAVVAAV